MTPKPVDEPGDVLAKWVQRNPVYRSTVPVWKLTVPGDREQVMRDVRVITPRPRPQPATPKETIGIWTMDLGPLVRHLTIDGYDRPLRRWAIERYRRGASALFFAGGLLAAAAIAAALGSLADAGRPGVLSVVVGLDLAVAALVLVYSFSRFEPIVSASLYARRWLDHMPRFRAAHRYRRLYDD